MAKTSIQYIKEAATKLVNSKLQRLGAAKTQQIFRGVMRTVGLETLDEVYLFVAHFDLTCRDQNSNMDDLSKYFGCSSLDMIEYVPALKSLESKGFLERRCGRDSNIMYQDYVVSDEVMAAIVENRPVEITTVNKEDVQIDKYEFCEKIAEKVEDKNVLTEELVVFAEKLEKSNPHLSFVKTLQKDVEDILDRILFYDICKDNFVQDGAGSSELACTMKDIYSNMSQRILVKKTIMDEKQILMRLGLVEKSEDDDNYYYLRLTDTGKEFFYGEDIYAFCKPLKCQDIYGVINRVEELFHNKDNYDSNWGDCICRSKIKRVMQGLEASNKHIPEVGQINRLIPDEFERVLFYSVGKNVIDDNLTFLSYDIRNIYPCRMRKCVLNQFKEEHHRLQTLGLVRIEKTSNLFGEQTHIVMTDEGKVKLLGEDAELYIEKVSDKLLLACDKIEEKTLFFSNGLSQQLSLLRNSLDDKYYEDLCVRLEENHLPKGICVLLYGEPGTGKTESVMQIAKATGRDIMHVDISATKTCWFGESEKLIKKVFTDYRRLCNKSKVKPILLFNEADAVFSKRKDVNSGSVVQTENAIQNIILEEMENLDGILIATTNLADNLDGAFERRFLFKIRFDNPTVEAKKNIWMNKLPLLSAQDAQTLAAGYEFSGGQIDNIVRKALMQEVIKGEKPTLDKLESLCSEEKISKNPHKRVGFC